MLKWRRCYIALAEVHESICGDQTGDKMNLVLKIQNLSWPIMVKDSFKFVKVSTNIFSSFEYWEIPKFDIRLIRFFIRVYKGETLLTL